MIVIADPPTGEDPRVAYAFIEYHPPLTRARRRELFPGQALRIHLGTCIYRAPGVLAPSKDVFNGVLAEVRQ
jgi:hypothetical protein